MFSKRNFFKFRFFCRFEENNQFMNLIDKILKSSKLNKKFLSFWVYSDEETFWFGQVIDYNKENIIIQHYTRYGKKDGIIIIKKSDIISIDINDDYSKAMTYIIENSIEISDENNFNLSFNFKENWQFELLKQIEGNYDFISSIEINNSYYSGFVEEVDKENFTFNLIGKSGEDEGLTMFKVEDITHFKINDIDNRKRLLLYNWRNK